MDKKRGAFEVFRAWSKHVEAAQAGGLPLPDPPIEAIRQVADDYRALLALADETDAWLLHDSSIPPRTLLQAHARVHKIIHRPRD